MFFLILCGPCSCFCWMYCHSHMFPLLSQHLFCLLTPCVPLSLHYSSGTCGLDMCVFRGPFRQRRPFSREMWWWEVGRDFQKACPKPEAPPVSSWEDVWKGTGVRIQNIIRLQAQICSTQGWTRKNQRPLYLHSGWPLSHKPAVSLLGGRKMMDWIQNPVF